MRQVALGTELSVPILGQGTWRLGEDRARAKGEAAALLAGIDAGMSLIDTAEMYGEGATESFLGGVLAGHHQDVTLVSKAYPQNASRARLPLACEGSLKRLRTDCLDVYLLHWQGRVPIGETVEAMEALVAAGKVRTWGVSNFDLDAMDDLMAAGGKSCVTNQVLYNVTRRGPEFDLVPWLADKGMALMAYSPIEQGRLPRSDALDTVAATRGVTPTQVALAWTMREGAIAIPKAASLAHVLDNRAAADLSLSAEDLQTLDAGFAPPIRRRSLEML